MIGIATILYTISRLLQTGADVCAVVANVSQHSLGNPSVPDEIVVAIVLFILGFRKITIFWILAAWYQGNASVAYVLSGQATSPPF